MNKMEVSRSFSYHHSSLFFRRLHVPHCVQVLQRNPGQLDRVLSSLDPATHSLGYLAALVARWEGNSNVW